VLGVAVLAAVFANQGDYASPSAFVDGFVPALMIGAATVAFGPPAALVIPRRRREAVALEPAPQPAWPNPARRRHQAPPAHSHRTRETTNREETPK